MSAYVRYAAFAFIAMAACTGRASHAVVIDTYGRNLDQIGMTLVDWEGQIANPLIRFTLTLPESAVLPATATLSADDSRLYFDQPSTVGQNGPRKTLNFTSTTPRSFRISIFPDRDGADETHTLSVNFVDAANTATDVDVAIHVIDQDVGDAAPFNITLDFSRDESGFFDNSDARDVLAQAAADWAWFIDDMNLDAVSPNQQITWIWRYPLAWTGPTPQGGNVGNSAGYVGYLLYAHGIDTAENRSGGSPSTCCFQHSGGAMLPLRRSGAVDIETQGNYNTIGWRINNNDADWWISGNLSNEQNDLYSIAHHEIGHALAFHSAYPGFASGESSRFNSPALLAYYGGSIASDAFDHFNGYIDPASGVGAFGYEYFGNVPRRRWLITKLDLLLLEAVGYTLRPTSPLAPLAVDPTPLSSGFVGASYDAMLSGSGGVPSYHWTLAGGALPPGLSLDSFTGRVSGTPSSDGLFEFNVALRDALGASAMIVPFSIEIESCTPGDVNDDGAINGLDLQTFVDVLLEGAGSDWERCAASVSVAEFVTLLLGSP
ncbi:MAG: putative Ig domain-containing protein [Phycisphaerales bacterium]|nr:putative Ig domain-containing protein [Phycisphaerales bacterium]